MKKYIKELLSETGTASIMRFAFIQLIYAGILIAFFQVLASFINAYLLYKNLNPINNDYFSLVSLLFSTAALLKVGQKVVENRQEKTQENQDQSQVQ